MQRPVETGKNVRLWPTELRFFARLGLQTIHVYDRPRVAVLSIDSNKIMLMNIHILKLAYESFYSVIYFNQSIDHLDLRTEYIRVVVEWSTKSSIPIVFIVPPDVQCSLRLLSARRCEGLDDYSR
ncbi:unnamed protein product [Rotaria magnacalcarata]|uniref:Uncharacterized protein n=1 Tax=Rotaria magnacalcarata TaxID=392030 RepID=A0A820BLW4_9BILA|nr:unnamed protein product [Rotaria magnacalcarata]CAF3966612.1 unnamed protein product [Rotaria magnacalcarata]CAF3987091.1 unnamed protein product [Rotaria magnacalcarata]CAF4142636.1 unnamed protein product [Rotaria magnacalcarata]CAF4194860.1 unnamed protein product [Rotaria magnacalcarata]